MKSLTFKDKQEGERWARGWAKELRPGDIVLLSGPMGSGKTQLVRWIVAAFGGGEEAASPTFAIHQEYETKKFRVDHMDLYRLESRSDFESVGLWDILNQKDGVLFVEWAERLPREWWPKDRRTWSINFQKVHEQERTIQFILSDC